MYLSGSRSVVQIRLTEAEKAVWVSQAGSRTLSDYLKFLVSQDGLTEDERVVQYESARLLSGAAKRLRESPVAATRVAVAQLTPKQQKEAPVSAVGRGFSTPVSDQVDVFFKATPAPKGRR